MLHPAAPQTIVFKRVFQGSVSTWFGWFMESSMGSVHVLKERFQMVLGLFSKGKKSFWGVFKGLGWLGNQKCYEVIFPVFRGDWVQKKGSGSTIRLINDRHSHLISRRIQGRSIHAALLICFLLVSWIGCAAGTLGFSGGRLRRVNLVCRLRKG